MLGRSLRSVVRSVLVAMGVVVVPATVALAQAPAAPPVAAAPAAAPPADAPAAAPAADAPAAANAAPAASGAAPEAKSSGGVTGYGYGARAGAAPPPSSTPHRPARMHHHANEVVATLPGFEMLADGGSRLFVQLTKSVDVTQAKAAPHAGKMHHTKVASAAAKGAAKLGVPHATSLLTITLKGTEIVKRNNENALVTVHFNTPVVRARLAPAGRDLRLVIELRSDVDPQVHVVPAKDGAALLQVDFPGGNYLPAGAPSAAPEPGGDAEDTTNSSAQ